MDLEIQHDEDANFGFIWGKNDNFHYLRSLNGNIKRVPQKYIDNLTQYSLSDENWKEDTHRVIQSLREDGFLDEGFPIIRLKQPEITLWPRVLLLVLMFLPLCYGLFDHSELFWKMLDVNERPPIWVLIYLPLLYLPTVLIHEYGHYRETLKYIPVRFEIGTVNIIFPTFKTITTETWMLNSNHRIWINLAGLFYQLPTLVVLVGIYYAGLVPGFIPGLEQASPWIIMSLPVLAISPLIPLYHGDGYLIMMDWLKTQNIRSKSVEELKSYNINLYSFYGLLSYGLIPAYLLIAVVTNFLVWGFIIGTIVLCVVGLFIISEYISEGDTGKTIEQSKPEWVASLEERTQHKSTTTTDEKISEDETEKWLADLSVDTDEFDFTNKNKGISEFKEVKQKIGYENYPEKIEQEIKESNINSEYDNIDEEEPEIKELIDIDPNEFKFE